MPTIRTLCSPETLQRQTRHGKSGKTLPSTGGSASLTSPSGAPLPVVGFHLRTTSKRRSPFLPTYAASTSTIRPGACLKSCVSPSQGINLILGMRTHITRRPTSGFACAHVAQGPFFHPKDAMRHNRDISGAWTTFVLDKSEDFTQSGVERLNDSIRTYVWAIVGAQAQTRSNILKTGTGFDAQKQFLAYIEDAIASPVDIPSSISRYQKTLQYASTPLDFMFGIGLYLSPSDMALHPGNIKGYNNEIQIAGSNAAIGHNPGINEAEPIASKGDKAFRGKIASPAGTVQRGRRTRRETAQLTTAARQRRNGRVRRPTKKNKRPLWPLG